MDYQLLKRFFEGKVTEEERKQVLSFIATKEFEDDVALLIKKHMSQNQGAHVIWDEHKFYDNLKKQLASEENQETLPGHEEALVSSQFDTYKPGRRAKSSYKWLIRGIAASLTILLAFTFFWKFGLDAGDTASLTAADAQISKTTGFGQKLSFYLSDGTRVILNSGSEITYPREFPPGRREVSVSGEVYFDVVKNPQKPFAVRSGDYATVVLGTSFVVKTLEDGINVSLKTGKVQIQKNYRKETETNVTTLLPGQAARLTQDKVEVKKFNSLNAFGWIDGTLYFDKTEFPEVIEKLRRWYDVEFTLTGQVPENKKYTSEYRNGSLENVLKGLGYIYDFDFEINGKVVHITFRQDNQM